MAVPLGTAGTPRRATNPKTGGHRPKKRLLRQVHPPDARCPMADQPRRYWCTYQQHCGNAGPGVTGARTSGIAGMPGPHESGQPPAGDRPKERRAPSLGLEGTNPRTGRPYFLTRSGPTTCPNCLRLVCPSSYGEFYSGLGAWYSCTYLRTPGFFLLFSFVSASSFCVLETSLLGRLTATREVVQLPQELLSITALGRYFRFATVGAPSVPLVREFGGNLQRHLACVQKVVFSLSCTTLSFLRFPMEGCPLFEGRLSDESLRRWRPISVRFPF